MDTLCSFCLQVNPSPEHMQKHLDHPSSLQNENCIKIAKHMQWERQNASTTTDSGHMETPQDTVYHKI